VKCSALNADFNGLRFDPLGSRSPPYTSASNLGTRLKTLLSTDLAREWLQIDRDLLHIITTTADELSGVPTSMTYRTTLNPPQNRGRFQRKLNHAPKLGQVYRSSDVGLRHFPSTTILSPECVFFCLACTMCV